MPTERIALPGSEITPVGTRTGDQPADEIITVSVILKPRSRGSRESRAQGPVVSREEFARIHGADPKDVEKVRRFAAEYNLTVSEVAEDRRTVQLQGKASDLVRAFEAQVGRYETDGHSYRGRSGSITLPANFAESVEAVLGLDDRPHVRPQFRIRNEGKIRPSAASGISYTPVQVAQLYGFPAGADGSGQTIAILELGGGYKPADLKKYFAAEGVSEPHVISVAVDGAKNKPTTPNGADGEVLLDIEVAGSVAPGAKIAVYFAPNTSQGFQDALTTAIHDKTNTPSVISISWGSSESTWTAQAMTAFDSAAQDAAALGVTICAASGDNGSDDGVGDGRNHVDFPASSPHILACGGTSLRGSGHTIQSESVWNDGTQGGAGGGGFSTQFPTPSWQSGIAATKGAGRGVPDVSGNADPETGYQVLVDGQSMVIGGTSAVAPLWSGLIALLNQQLGKPVGFLQPAIYSLPASAGAFNDITQGNNGAFSAGPGWDAASGLGSPNGAALLAALGAHATPPKHKKGSH